MSDVWEDNKGKWLAMLEKHTKEKRLRGNLDRAKKEIPGEGGTKYAKLDTKGYSEEARKESPRPEDHSLPSGPVSGKGKSSTLMAKLKEAIKYVFGGSQIEINEDDLLRIIDAKRDRELQQRDDNVNALEDTWEK
jgi:hypothetical protein